MTKQTKKESQQIVRMVQIHIFVSIDACSKDIGKLGHS
jgi:hypothetical protein